MTEDIDQLRTELLKVMAEAGRLALKFDPLSAAAFAPIPNTAPQQYVVAGTLPMIAKVLPAESSTDWRPYHSALSRCAELLDNMKDGDPITEVPNFLAAYLASQSQAAQPSDLDAFEAICPEVYTDAERELLWKGWQLAGQSQATRAVPEDWRAFIENCADMAGGMVSGNRLAIVAKELLVAPTAQEVTHHNVKPGVPTSAKVQADEAQLYRDLTGDASALGFDGIPAALETLRATQQAAKAETAEQGAREMAIAQAVRRACVESYSPDDLADDWSEKMGDLNLSSIIKSVSPTTSTVSAPEEDSDESDDACRFCEGQGEVQGYGSALDIDPPIRKCSECDGSGKAGYWRTTSGKGEAA